MSFLPDFPRCTDLKSYELQTAKILDKIRKDKKYKTNEDVIFLIIKYQELFAKHKDLKSCFFWKCWLGDFNKAIGDYWFFSEWVDLRNKNYCIAKNWLKGLCKVMRHTYLRKLIKGV